MTDTTEGTRAIASTVSTLPGSARERFGDALAARYKSGDEWQRDHLRRGRRGDRGDRARPGRSGIEPGDRVCILANTRLEWTLASYGDLRRRRRRRAGLPDQFPHGVRVGGGQLGARAVVVRERGASGEDRRGPRRAPRPRARDRDRAGRRRDDARRAARARARAATASELAARQAQRRPRRPVHDRLHVGHDRPAEGRRADPRQRDVRVPHRRGARVRRARRDHLPVPAARPRVRAARRSSPPSTRARRSSISAATRSRSSRRSSRPSRPTCRRSRGSSRSSTRRR